VIPRSRSAVVVAFLTTLAACQAPESESPSAATSVQSGSPPAASSSTAASASASAGGWTELRPSATSPKAREDHTWTISPDGATAYLFGGRDGPVVYDDLWSYSFATATWTSLAASGDRPPARFGHNAAWADGIGLIIFAGQAGGDFFNDLWAYDPATNAWRELPAGGAVPVARYGSCAAIAPDGRLWISHGFTSEGQRFADTRAYDFQVASWTDETPAGDTPIRRCLHACWWTDDGAMTLYGGQTTGTTALGDLWRLTPGERPGTNAWTQLAVTGGMPPARNLYAASRWGAGTLVFGGQGLDADYLGDTWLLADASATWMRIEADGPSTRAGAELIPDADGERLLLFGGHDASAVFGDLWQLAVPGSP
jgi:hypothetical protein